MVVLEDEYVAVATNTNVVQYYRKWRDPNIWLSSIVLCRGVYYSVVRLHVFRIVNNTFSDNFAIRIAAGDTQYSVDERLGDNSNGIWHFRTRYM